MIIHLEQFVSAARPYWEELEALLRPIEERAEHRMDLAEAQRFYYLYRRAASDLARLKSATEDPALLGYVEGLVARAYGQIHETRAHPYRLHLRQWFFETLPQTFRRRIMAFHVATLAVCVGGLLGAGALLVDPDAKEVIMPFEGLHGDPSDRVAEEERRESGVSGGHGSFAGMLMVNNIRVSIMALALGIAFGFGTIVILFYNGVIIGAVLLDYIRAGESVFLAGWLLPHGSIEIPAILIAGQAGLVLGHAMIGWGSRLDLRTRLRLVSNDLVTLIFGVAILLVWAGLVESFFSQYHEPVFPYSLKILFGLLQLVLLFVFLMLGGRASEQAARAGEPRHA